MTLSTLLILEVCKTLVVWNSKIWASIPRGESEFFFDPRSWQDEKKNFLTKKEMLFISLWKVRKEIAYFAPWCSTARIQRPWSLVDRLIHWVYNHFILLLCITRTNNNESVVWVNWSTTRKGARVYFPQSGWLSNLQREPPKFFKYLQLIWP